MADHIVAQKQANDSTKLRVQCIIFVLGVAKLHMIIIKLFRYNKNIFFFVFSWWEVLFARTKLLPTLTFARPCISRLISVLIIVWTRFISTWISVEKWCADSTSTMYLYVFKGDLSSDIMLFYVICLYNVVT